MRNLLKKNAARGMGSLRALLYTAESLPLPIMNRWITGEERRLPTGEQQRLILKKVNRLLDKDAQDFADLNWPLAMLRPEAPLKHFPRLAHILGDSTLSFWRRRNNKTQEFSKKVKDLDNYPEYYQRNFHHQTDGYLTEDSAAIYEHQVELLFRGLADPMRRRLLPLMQKHLQQDEPIEILEIGCGSGTFTRFLAMLFPKAHITAVDMSPSYISFSKKRLIEFKNIDFVVAKAEELPYKKAQFDAVVSVFLHHELPRKVREQVLDESLRVCKKEGFWGLLDSIQLGDDRDLDWAIKEFPKTFHEPFFTNYIKSPLIDYLKDNHSKRLFREKPYLLSKVVYSSGS